MYLLYWGDVLVGFNSFLNMPSGTNKYCFRTHRLVILPDYQGLGIGTKFEEFMGEYFLSQGQKLFLRTTHLRLGRHCSNSLKWKASATNQVQRVGANESNEGTSQGKKYKQIDDKRIAYSFEYVGQDYNTKPHQYIVCMGDCSLESAEKVLNNMIDTDKHPIVVTGTADQKEINVWEEVAKSKGIRTEILFTKRKGEMNLVKTHLEDKFDCVLIGTSATETLRPYKNYIRQGYII